VLEGSGAGTNILVGGPGDDQLTGGDGRDLLIGGTGTDVVHGGGGQDILIGGATDFDQNATALAAIMMEWRRTDADYATRVHHLDGSLAGGLNDGFFLNVTTVHDDGSNNDLLGNQDLDWFLAGLNDATDKHKDEIVTNVS
jgi:Ca2+-binding RTX toxin-like protein